MCGKSRHIYEVNKGKICKEPGCNFIARTKGYCTYCYTKNQRDRMTYKKAGIDVEKEEQAIRILIKDMNKDGKQGIIKLNQKGEI